jgi:SAM-dependent methyltransferase
MATMYDKIARFYDLTHASLTADIPFVLQLARQSEGAVLELGCGSGRLLLPLAQAGFQVTGVDSSMEMLARAKVRLAKEEAAVQQRVTLIKADMTSLTLPSENRFGLILIPYNTFMHLDRTQALLVLRRVRNYLVENGRLFIDLPNPLDIANISDDQLLNLENVLTDPDSGELIVHLSSNRLDSANQTLHITWIYDVSQPDGGAVNRTLAQAVYHYRYPHQMELLLQEAGFKLTQLLGNYDQSPYNEESKRLLILAK